MLLFADARTVRAVLLYCLLLLSIFSNFLYLVASLVARLGRLIMISRPDWSLLAVMSLTDLALCVSALGLQITLFCLDHRN